MALEQHELLRMWREAGTLVSQYITRDQSVPDLLDLLHPNSTGEYAMENAQFSHVRSVMLPQALLEQYHHIECKCFMGLFPEIHRAWITIDNQLFLWNYEDGRDFCVYDGLDQIIISAALVVPRPGVFLAHIKYLLVLATPVEIVLLGVGFEDNNIAKEATLYPTQLCVPSDNIHMLKIVGSPVGRIFMCGKDGCLYELDYEAEDGWFRSKCRKLNHSKYRLSSLLPSFLKLMSGDSIVDIALDNTRNILYTLSEKSVVQVFDLGKDGYSAPSKVVSKNCSDFAKHASHLQNLQVISLHPVPSTESGPVHLIAVTSSGIRLFFTTFSDELYPWSSHYRNNESRPSTLDLLHVRTPPNTDRFGFGTVHTTFYQQGVFVFASAFSEEDADNLFCIAADLSKRPPVTEYVREDGGRKVQHGLCELVSTPFHNASKAWAIAEMPMLFSVFPWAFVKAAARPPQGPPYIVPSSDVMGLNELALDFTSGGRSFVVLTNTGLHVISKQRPLDQLCKLLVEANHDNLAGFFKRFHEDQTCAMCLALACATPSRLLVASPKPQAPSVLGPSGPAPVTTDPNVPLLATRAFFHYGGAPRFDRPPVTATGYGRTDMRLMERVQVLFSAAHNGLYVYMARLCSGVWNFPIVLGTPGGCGETAKVHGPRLSPQQWDEVQAPLARLLEFLERNPSLISSRPVGPSYGPGQPPSASQGISRLHALRPEDEAVRLERRSLSDAFHLLKRIIEGLALMALLSDHNISRLASNLAEDVQKRLVTVTFQRMVSFPEDMDISKQLITQLLKMYQTENLTVEGMCTVLRERCPSFFSETDLLKGKAGELLSRAKSVGPQSVERLSLLREALELYCNAAASVTTVQAKTICTTFRELHFHPGVVELALAQADAVDPNNDAVHMLTTPDDAKVKQAYDKRLECYKNIWAALDELQSMETLPSPPNSTQPPTAGAFPVRELKAQTFARALASQDALFHTVLYRWFIACKLTRELLDVSTPFIEGFLLRENVNLLWQYCVHHGKHQVAATLLAKLAERSNQLPPEPGMHPPTLEERIHYLSQAIANAKSVNGRGAQVQNYTLHDLQEKMEVADIQLRIYNELRAGSTPAMKQAAETLNQELFGISDLYNRYACPHRLWELQLAVFNCSGHDDQGLIQECWRNIIRDELSRCDGPQFRLDALAAKVLSVGRLYYPSPTFPLEFLVNTLEQQSLNHCTRFAKNLAGWKQEWVLALMHEIGVPPQVLYEVFKRLFESKDAVWRDPQAQLHLLNSLQCALGLWLEQAEKARPSQNDLRALARLVEDDIGKFTVALGTLQLPGVPACTSGFKTLHRRLQNWHQGS